MAGGPRNSKHPLDDAIGSRALEISLQQEKLFSRLENGTPMDGPRFAHRVGIRPVRRVYAYLDRLAALGLVARRNRPGEQTLLFQITERGLKRLEWLRARDKPSNVEKLLIPILRRAPS